MINESIPMTKCDVCERNGRHYHEIESIPLELNLCVFCRELIKEDFDNVETLWCIHLAEFKNSLKKLLIKDYVE